MKSVRPICDRCRSGVSTHPGVGINGGGRATARVILEDLGIDFKKVIAN